MSIGISAESTIDLRQEDLDKYGINTLHFHVYKGQTEEGFDNLFHTGDLFKYTLSTGNMCKTSACNIGELEEHFAKLFKKYTDIIHFTISSAISSGYNNAMAVAADNPHIAVIDSHGTSGQIAIQAIYARKLINAGYPFDEVVKMVLARRPYAECSFQLDRLDFLYKGGRCSKLSMIGANILHLKPEIVCTESENGKFNVGKKHRGGTKKCILEYIDDTIQGHPNIDPSICFFDYSTMEDPSILEEAKAKVLGYGFKEVNICEASPTNAYHAGPNVLGIHFYFDGPHEVAPYKG